MLMWRDAGDELGRKKQVELFTVKGLGPKLDSHPHVRHTTMSSLSIWKEKSECP